ncbi:MAG: Uma2 family endonuclease [Janthinobacterium lividum]
MALAEKYLTSFEKDFYTEDEYFAFERTSIGHWEYVNGEIRAMSGGTANHSMIAMNIGATLRATLLPKGCRVFGSDMKVHTGDGNNTFPDISVVCGPLEFYRGRTDLITNPLLIVEVLSDSTEPYDRGEKFRHFQTIPTLTDYLLVSQHENRVELFTRREDHWEYRTITGLTSTVHLPSIETDLAFSDIYALIELAVDTAV